MDINCLEIKKNGKKKSSTMVCVLLPRPNIVYVEEPLDCSLVKSIFRVVIVGKYYVPMFVYIRKATSGL